MSDRCGAADARERGLDHLTLDCKQLGRGEAPIRAGKDQPPVPEAYRRRRLAGVSVQNRNRDVGFKELLGGRFEVPHTDVGAEQDGLA